MLKQIRSLCALLLTIAVPAVSHAQIGDPPARTEAKGDATASAFNVAPRNAQTSMNKADNEAVLHARLREAVRWLAKGPTDQGLAVLRRMVTDNPDTTLATEAQCEIGHFFWRQGREDDAVREFKLCEHLPGCDAFDEAGRAIFAIQYWRRQKAMGESAPTYSQEPPKIDWTELRATLATLKTHPLDRAGERRLAAWLLRDLLVQPLGEKSDRAAEVLTAAVMQFRSQECRYALNFGALQLRSHQMNLEVGTTIPDALRYARSAASPQLRAGALAIALMDGYLNANPRRIDRELQPLLRNDPFALRHTEAIRPPKQFKTMADLVDAEARADFQNAIQRYNHQLVHLTMGSGRLQDAITYLTWVSMLPVSGAVGPQSGTNSYDEMKAALPRAEWRAVAMFELAQLMWSRFPDAEAHGLLFDLVARYPHSAFAPLALGDMALMARLRHNAEAARPAEALLRTKYPGSFPDLALRAQDAFADGDYVRAHDLVVKCREAFNALDSRLAAPFAGLIQVRDEDVSGCEALKSRLQPLLDAAGDPSLATPRMLRSDGLPLAEALVKALPARKTEIYRQLKELYWNVALQRRFIENAPDDPQVGAAWKFLAQFGQGFSGSPPADLHYPENVRWVIPFVNRGESYRHHAVATALLIDALTEQKTSSIDLKKLNQRVADVKREFPATRAAMVANVALVQMELFYHRPEEVRKTIGAVLAELPVGAALRAEALRIQRQADIIIAEKHRQDWTPLWSVALKPAQARASGEAPMAQSCGDCLLVMEPDAANNRQIVALEMVDGRRAWTTGLSDSVRDIATSPDTHRLYALLATGQVACVNATTGNTIWTRSPSPAKADQAPEGIVAANDAVIVYGAACGTLCLDAADGACRWQRHDWAPVQWFGWRVQGKPVIVGDDIAGHNVIMAAVESVVALSLTTGKLAWTHDYPLWPLLSPEPGGRLIGDSRFYRSRSILTQQPVMIDDTHLIVRIERPSLRYEVIDGLTGKVTNAADVGEFVSSPPMFAAEGGFLFEFGYGSKPASWRLPNLTPLSTSLAGTNARLPLAVDRNTIYTSWSGGYEIDAQDIETGCLYAKCPIRQHEGAITVVCIGNRVCAVCADGTVTAAPLRPALPEMQTSGRQAECVTVDE